MYGYSNFDNYFGLNTTNCMPYGNTFGNPMVRRNGIGTIPGINAPKKKDYTEVKTIGVIAAGIAAVVMAIKGRKSISAALKTVFSGNAAKKVSKDVSESGIGSRIKKLFKKSSASETAEKAGTGFFAKIKNILPFKKDKVATEVTQAAETVKDSIVKSVNDLPEEARAEATQKLMSVLHGVQEKVTPLANGDLTQKVGALLDVTSKA